MICRAFSADADCLGQGFPGKKAETMDGKPHAACGLLEAVTNGADAIVAAVDSDFRFIFLNETARQEGTRLTGKEFRLGDSLSDLFADMPEQREIVVHNFARALQGESHRQRVKFGDAGRYRRYYNARFTPIRDRSGAVAGAGVVAFDVTDQAGAEKELRATQRLLLRTQELARVGGWVADIAAGTCVNSPLAARIKGLPEATVPCSGFFAIVDPDDAPWLERAWRDAVADVRPYEEEYRIRIGGEIRWVHEKAEIERGADGKALRSTGMVQDITARKLAEAKLRQLSLVVEQSPESIVITDLDANIIYVNDAFVRKTGYSREELIGHNPRILNSGKTPRENYVGLWDALSAGRTWTGEFINRCKDGSEYVESAIVSPICQPDGRISHYLAIKEDITDKKNMTAELMLYQEHLQELVAERTAQLEASNDELTRAEKALLAEQERLEQRVVERTRQLRRLAVDATLSEERERQAIARDLHDDLGQILHAVRLKLDTLAKSAPHDIGSQAQEIGGLLAEASARVRSLTSQLSPPVLATMGLVPALAWLAEEMERTYGLTVEVDDDGLPKPLTAAQSAILFRAVRELLINVSKHAGVPFARIDAASGDGMLILTVEDEGRGFDDMAEALMGRNGFGLASVRERITYLDGSMEIRSIPGDGSVVTLSMPLTPQPASSKGIEP